MLNFRDRSLRMISTVELYSCSIKERGEMWENRNSVINQPAKNYYDAINTNRLLNNYFQKPTCHLLVNGVSWTQCQYASLIFSPKIVSPYIIFSEEQSLKTNGRHFQDFFDLFSWFFLWYFLYFLWFSWFFVIFRYAGMQAYSFVGMLVCS